MSTHPGPRPSAPVFDDAAAERLVSAIDALDAELARSRTQVPSAYEQAQVHLAGPLRADVESGLDEVGRRIGTVRDGLQEQRDAVRAAQAAAEDARRQFAVDLGAWGAARASWQREQRS